MKDESKPKIGKVYDRLKDSIENGNYTNFLFLTYRIDPIFEWFPNSSQVNIFAPKEAIDKALEKVDDLPETVSYKFHELKTHAKIYLMWNSQKIMCFLGSFNFTTTGMRFNLEWVIEKETPLIKILSYQDIITGKIEENTQSFLINQILSLVSGFINGYESNFRHRIIQRLNTDIIVLDNQYQNSMKFSLKTLISSIENTNKEATLTYIVPFVTLSGVNELFSDISEEILKEKIHVRILTNMPKYSRDKYPTFLNSEHIYFLKEKFKSFTLLKRRKGKGGSILPNGTELSRGFMHMKLLHVTVVGRDQIKTINTFFTTANLTGQAWGGSNGNSELAIWIRNQEENEEVSEFINDFTTCFSEFDNQELSEIDELWNIIYTNSYIRDEWLDDILRDKLKLVDDKLVLQWGPSDPIIWDVKGIVIFRDITSQKITEINCTFQPTIEGWSAEILSYFKKNTIINYVDIIFKSHIRFPQIIISEKGLKGRFIQEKNKAYFDLTNMSIPNDSTYLLVINSNRIRIDNRYVEIPNLVYTEQIAIRKTSEKANIYRAPNIIIKEQTHFKNIGFFKTINIVKCKIPYYGEAYRADIIVNEYVDPPYDTIVFKDETGKTIKFSAYSYFQKGISYYFTTNAFNLTAWVTLPYSRYFGEESYNTSFNMESLNTLENRKKIQKPIGLRIIDSPVSPTFYAYEKLITEKTHLRFQSTKPFADDRVKFLVLIKEDLYVYKAPILNNNIDPIAAGEPFSKMNYCGAYQIDDKDTKINILTDIKSYYVRKAILNNFQVIDVPKIPRRLPLHNIKDNYPIMLIHLDVDNIQFIEGLVGEYKNTIRNRLNISAWKNNIILEEQILPLLSKGRKFLIPIFKSEVGSVVRVRLLAGFDDEDALSNFGWFCWESEYKLRFKDLYNPDESILIEMDNGSKQIIPITGDPASTFSELYVSAELARGRIPREYSHLVKEQGRNEIELLPETDLLIRLDSKFRRNIN